MAAVRAIASTRTAWPTKLQDGDEKIARRTLFFQNEQLKTLGT
jgi:hypothetical protein